jgi:hypothetical protein
MIYTISDVKRACNQTLKTAFPKVTIYDNDTLDGYKRPSFFTEILSHGRRKTSQYLTQIGFTYRITYFETTHDEAHCLEVYEKICQAFEPAIKVKGHVRIVVNNTDYAWIDENADKLQVTISFYDAVELGGYVEEDEPMQELNMDMEIESED